MKAPYDRVQDILYLAFKDGPGHEIIESSPNIVLELDKKREIVGLEIWNAKKTGLLEQVAKVAAGSYSDFLPWVTSSLVSPLFGLAAYDPP